MSPTTRALTLLVLAGCAAGPSALSGEAPADRALPGAAALSAARGDAGGHSGLLGAAADHSWSGAAGSAFGYGATGVGDLDGDGHDDIAIGSNRESSYAGAMRVYMGGAAGPSATADHTYTGGSSEQLGRAPVGGDFDGDGYSDLVVGSAFAGSGRQGRADVYPGSASGLDSTPARSITGTTSSSYVGIGMAVGDFDADGYDDLVLGEYPRNRIQVYPGGAGGLATSPGVTLSGPGGNSYFGQYNSVGDINGDGYDDLVAVDYGWTGTTGKAYLFEGGSAGLSAAASWSVEGTSTASWMAEVGASGDLDGDGFDDIAVGTRDAGGTVQVFFGSSAGPSTTADLTITGVGGGWPVPRIVADMDLDGYDDLAIGWGNGPTVAVHRGGPGGPSTTADLTLSGTVSGGGFGGSLESAGDVNGDGVPDLIVGEWSASMAHLYLGQADADADGIPADADCDDRDPDIGDPIDLFVDLDGDGWGHGPTTACPGDAGVVDRDGDCDDSDAEIAPQVEERPGDGIDQDCDGVELCFQDMDGDGVRTELTIDSPDLACDGEGEGSIDDLDGDCDDDDATVFPGAEDLPDDGVDQDCDGADATEAAGGDTGDTGDAGDTGADDTGADDTGTVGDDDDDGGGKASCSAVPGASLAAGLLGALVALARRRDD